MSLTCAVALAQRGVGPDGALLHERLPAERERRPVPVFVYDPRSTSALPRAIHQDGLVLPSPGWAPTLGQDHPPYEDRGGPAPGATEDHGAPPGLEARGSLGNAARPDRDTEMESTLHYTASFDPSVVPFKRNRALNQVSPTGDLVLRGGEHQPVKVLGHRVAEGREIFWGSIQVRSRGDEAIPLPTVSPDSRVLGYETEPRRELRFERDAADNLYLRAGGPGDFRLLFLLDADRRYFSRGLPLHETVESVPASLRPILPPPYQERGLAVAERLGLSASMPYGRLVDGLVKHFRSFKPGAPPPVSGDIYSDLALGKRGICRHRGYAFLITAQALGIPARYVFNEAHVFVEIWMPGKPSGWIRADLGGGAEHLNIEGGSGRVRHLPQGGDPFTRPKAYAQQLLGGSAAGAGQVTGMPRRPERTQRPEATKDKDKGEAQRLHLEAAMVLPPPQRGAEPSRVTLTLPKPLIFRGDALSVQGLVQGESGEMARAGGQVQVVLRSREGGHVLGLLGVAQTDEHGRWSTSIVVPVAWPPGAYDLRAEYLGDRHLAPGVSP